MNSDLITSLHRLKPVFYGTQDRSHYKDAFGAEKWQVGTIQVDYVMPERFDPDVM